MLNSIKVYEVNEFRCKTLSSELYRPVVMISHISNGIFLDFKLSLCSNCNLLSFGQVPGVHVTLIADVSELSVGSILISKWMDCRCSNHVEGKRFLSSPRAPALFGTYAVSYSMNTGGV